MIIHDLIHLDNRLHPAKVDTWSSSKGPRLIRPVWSIPMTTILGAGGAMLQDLWRCFGHSIIWVLVCTHDRYVFRPLGSQAYWHRSIVYCIHTFFSLGDPDTPLIPNTYFWAWMKNHEASWNISVLASSSIALTREIPKQESRLAAKVSSTPAFTRRVSEGCSWPRSNAPRCPPRPSMHRQRHPAASWCHRVYVEDVLYNIQVM